MCSTGKILQEVISSCLQQRGSQKAPQLLLFLCFPFYKCTGLASKFNFPLLTVQKKIPLKVPPPLCSPHQVKAPDDLHQGLGQRYCLKASSEYQLHCAFPLFVSMTCPSWPWRVESTSATVLQINSPGTSGQESASWLLCWRRVSCLLQLDETQKNGWQHLHWRLWSCIEFGTKQIRESSKINKQMSETKQPVPW